MSIFRCDWEKKGRDCAFKPFAEIYYKDDDKDSKWCYLCLWHFLYAKLRGDDFGWCKVDTDRETLEHIKEEIWDIESTLEDIKEKLGIKTEYADLDTLKKLWDNPEDECWNETKSKKKKK